MTKETMAQALEGRRKAVLARVRLREWARARGPGADLAPSGVQPAMAFWYSEEGEGLLPDAAVHGLASAVRWSGVEVHLWTYQSFENVPAGVRVRDAREVLSWEEFDAAVARVGHVALAADLVRLRAMRRSASLRSWFWDCDTLVLRDVRCVEVGQEAHGHVFASLPAPPGAYRGTRAAELRWRVEFLVRPRDKRFIASPFCLPRDSPMWPGLLERLEEVVLGDPGAGLVDYNVFMNAVAREMKAWGLEDAVLRTSAFSPIPPWTGGACLKPRAHTAIDLQVILEKALGVNCFWQSRKGCMGAGACERGADARVQPESVWARLLEAVQSGVVFGERSEAGGPKRRRLAKKTSATEPCEPPLKWPEPLWRFPLDWRSSPHSAFSQCSLRNTYELVRVLGEGSYAKVYEARCREGGPAVAVKVCVSPRPQVPVDPMELYFHEKSQGPGVVRVLDAWWSPSFSVLVLERMREDVRGMLRNRPGGRVEEGTVGRIVQGAAQGLRQLHDAFVMHRDLHTGNVLLSHTAVDGEDLRPEQVHAVKIADFGKAQEVRNRSCPAAEVQMTGTCGARDIMPPEALFRRGTVWTGGASMPSRVSASSQPAPRPTGFAVQRAPRGCYYTEAVDVWALGCLLLACAGRALYSSREKGEMGKDLVWMLGRVPRDVAERLQWSLPSAWVAGRPGETETTQVLGCRALGENGCILRAVLRYDPCARARAGEVATATRTEEGGQ
ncbi:MAG: protein kinase [bacterium]|nr:protein kinase [bacterium]